MDREEFLSVRQTVSQWIHSSSAEFDSSDIRFLRPRVGRSFGSRPQRVVDTCFRVMEEGSSLSFLLFLFCVWRV